MTSRDFLIAGLRLRLDDEIPAFSGLEPFRTTAEGTPDLEIRTAALPDIPPRMCRTIDTFDFADADAECLLSRCLPTAAAPSGAYLFTLAPRSGRRPVRFFCGIGSRLCLSDFRHDDLPALFRFGLWMMLNIHAVGHHAAAIHSSVILHRGEGILFLGESGTGKSTHTRLWRQHIPGCELLNDDSPFVRAAPGGAPLVCGSPWSGKSPCYRPLEVPIRAFVRLSQGPDNRIGRLPLLRAYGALHPSFPPSLAHDEPLADGVNILLSRLLASVPVYHLSCRPDAAAVHLAYSTIYGNS